MSQDPALEPSATALQRGSPVLSALRVVGVSLQQFWQGYWQSPAGH